MAREKLKPKKSINVFVLTSVDGVEGIYRNKNKAESKGRGIEQDLLFGGTLLPRVKVTKFKVE